MRTVDFIWHHLHSMHIMLIVWKICLSVMSIDIFVKLSINSSRWRSKSVAVHFCIPFAAVGFIASAVSFPVNWNVFIGISTLYCAYLCIRKDMTFSTQSLLLWMIASRSNVNALHLHVIFFLSLKKHLHGKWSLIVHAWLSVWTQDTEFLWPATLSFVLNCISLWDIKCVDNLNCFLTYVLNLHVYYMKHTHCRSLLLSNVKTLWTGMLS